MGSTLETSIVFVLVLGMLTFMLIKPFDLVKDCEKNESEYYEELKCHSKNDKILDKNSNYLSTSPEKLYTLLKGFSSNYESVYSNLADFSKSK